MKLNQKLIQQLRNGEIAVENSGTVEQLREVLKSAFPEDTWVTDGSSSYYYLSTAHVSNWTCRTKTNLPTVKISDFYQPELFTGWAKDDNDPKWMFYFKNDVAKFGFSALGVWREGGNVNYSECQNNRPATNEEIKGRLTKEAINRGYKGGNTIKGIHGTVHKAPEISSFHYYAEYDVLLTNSGCIVYKAGQWSEIVEQPEQIKTKSNPIHYTVGGTTYSLNYQELKAKYQSVVNYSDEGFMANLPQIAHLACVVSFFKSLGVQATISDKGIIHELIHLMTDPNEPTNDLAEIREKFNHLIRLV